MEGEDSGTSPSPLAGFDPGKVYVHSVALSALLSVHAPDKKIVGLGDFVDAMIRPHDGALLYSMKDAGQLVHLRAFVCDDDCELETGAPYVLSAEAYQNDESLPLGTCSGPDPWDQLQDFTVDSSGRVFEQCDLNWYAPHVDLTGQHVYAVNEDGIALVMSLSMKLRDLAGHGPDIEVTGALPSVGAVRITDGGFWILGGVSYLYRISLSGIVEKIAEYASPPEEIGVFSRPVALDEEGTLYRLLESREGVLKQTVDGDVEVLDFGFDLGKGATFVTGP